MKKRLRWAVGVTGTSLRSSDDFATRAGAEARIRRYQFTPDGQFTPVRILSVR